MESISSLMAASEASGGILPVACRIRARPGRALCPRPAPARMDELLVGSAARGRSHGDRIEVARDRVGPPTDPSYQGQPPGAPPLSRGGLWGTIAWSPTPPPASLSATALPAPFTRELSWPALRSPFAASNLIDRQSVAEYENGEIAIQMSHAKVGVQRRGSRRREDEQDVAI
jgi:hypothetical protein